MTISPCSMSFLRPLGPPRPAVFLQFMGLSSSARRRTEVLSPNQSSKSTPTGCKESYIVRRTSSNNLPIYLLAKRGGNLQQTRIKKIEGNIMALRDQLQEVLGLGPKEVTINQLTRQIIIKGWKKPQVAEFLEKRQF